MKKMIVTAIMTLMLIFGAFAQSEPKVLYNLSLGFVPQEFYGMETPNYNFIAEIHNEVVTELYLGVQYEGFYAGGGTLTKSLFIGSDKEPISFNAFYTQYKFNMGWRFKEIQIQYEHLCGHPDTPWYGGVYNVPQAMFFNMASDTVSISLKNF